jgi:hypothetical protein
MSHFVLFVIRNIGFQKIDNFNVIFTDWIYSCKSNCHAITTMTTPELKALPLYFGSATLIYTYIYMSALLCWIPSNDFYSIFSFMCMFCRSLFVLLYFIFSPLCCLFYFDIWILITPLIFSNFSHNIKKI